MTADTLSALQALLALNKEIAAINVRRKRLRKMIKRMTGLSHRESAKFICEQIELIKKS